MALNKLTFIACSFLVSLLILTWEIQSIDARYLKSRSSELQNLPIHNKTHENKKEDDAGHKSDLHGKSSTEASLAVSPPPPQSGQVGGAAQPPPPPAHAAGPQLQATAPASDTESADTLAKYKIVYFNSTRHMIVYYEDVNRSKLKVVQEFLGLPRMKLTSRQVKIHNGPLSDHIKNWEDVQKTLMGTPYEEFLRSDY